MTPKWPIKHVRVCGRCDQVRWAPCNIACGIPPDIDPDSWDLNAQWQERNPV